LHCADLHPGLTGRGAGIAPVRIRNCHGRHEEGTCHNRNEEGTEQKYRDFFPVGAGTLSAFMMNSPARIVPGLIRCFAGTGYNEQEPGKKSGLFFSKF
jgi:hypothetical protein